MPTITYDKRDLASLAQNVSLDQLVETMQLMKTNVEEDNESEITVEMTPDRPDLFGIEGLVRALKQYLGLQKGLKNFKVESPKVHIKASHIGYRPYVAAAVVKNVTMTDGFIKSLMNIQDVLTDTIGRKRKKVAIGIHDFDRIIPNLFYTEANKNEKIVPLDTETEMTLAEVLEKTPKGKEYANVLQDSEKVPVFLDAKGIFSFPPIINSERTRVTEKTKNLLVELTGTDKDAVLQTLNIIVTNFAERGAVIEAVKIFYGEKSEVTPNLNPTTINIELGYVDKWLGINLKKNQVFDLLGRMGYDVVENRSKLTVYVPAYRTDILHPMDIIEDIAIAYGFNDFVPELPGIATIGKPHSMEKLSNRARQLMIGFGFQELIKPILTSQKDLFDKMNVEREKVIELENPVSEDYSCLRNWLLPSLMKVLSMNKHVEYPQNVFEVGDVVIIDDKEETMTKTGRKLACVMSHSKANYAEIKAVLESLLKQMGVKYSFKESKLGHLIDGRQGYILMDNKQIGYFGEVNPVVVTNFGLEIPCTAFEFYLEVI